MIVITITQDDEEGLNVHHHGAHAGGHLTVGEMLEQVLALLKAQPKTLQMRTSQQWEEGREMGRNAFMSLVGKTDPLAQERTAIANEARRYASHYPEASDGRNTFVLLAEWIEGRE